MRLFGQVLSPNTLIMQSRSTDRQTDRQTQSSYIKYRLGSTYHNSAVVVHKIWLTCRKKKKNLISIDMITLHKYTQIKCQFFHFNELQNITKTGLYGHNFRTNKDRRYFYFYFYCFCFFFCFEALIRRGEMFSLELIIIGVRLLEYL